MLSRELGIDIPQNVNTVAMSLPSVIVQQPPAPYSSPALPPGALQSQSPELRSASPVVIAPVPTVPMSASPSRIVDDDEKWTNDDVSSLLPD